MKRKLFDETCKIHGKKNSIVCRRVIKYQLHLMTHEKLPERKAYAKATHEFYELRARQEEVERQVRSQMEAALQELESKKWTRQALELEERALKEGQERISI